MSDTAGGAGSTMVIDVERSALDMRMLPSTAPSSLPTYLYPVRSASLTAAAWNSPAAATLMSSCLNFPHLATTG